MIKANIGDEKFTKIKESWKYSYVFHAVRIINDPTAGPLQKQLHHLIPMINKRDADNFARNPKVANYVSAKLIHDPVSYRLQEKEEKIRQEEEERARQEAKEKAEAERKKKETQRTRAKSKAKK